MLQILRFIYVGWDLPFTCLSNLSIQQWFMFISSLHNFTFIVNDAALCISITLEFCSYSFLDTLRLSQRRSASISCKPSVVSVMKMSGNLRWFKDSSVVCPTATRWSVPGWREENATEICGIADFDSEDLWDNLET